jgi:hypothetical protein
MSLRAYAFEAIVLAVLALFICAIVAWGGILHSGGVMTCALAVYAAHRSGGCAGVPGVAGRRSAAGHAANVGTNAARAP